MTFLKISALSVALTLIAFLSNAATGGVSNGTGCDVDVTITYVCNGQTYTTTFTAWKAQSTIYSVPTGCCVISALFEYSTSSITLTGVGYDCSGTGDDDCGECDASCATIGLTGKICIDWIDQLTSGCENAPSFAIGCGCF